MLFLQCQRVFPVLLVAMLNMSPLFSAQIPVTGVTEEAVYPSGSPPTFSVPVEPGYIYPQALLDDKRIPVGRNITVTEPGYHTVYVERRPAAGGDLEASTVQFIWRREGVGSAEDGLPAWVPYPTIPSSSEEVADAALDVMIPPAFPAGLEIPVVAWIRDAGGKAVRASGPMRADGHPDVMLRRGVGSGFLAANHPAGSLSYTAQLHGLSTPKSVDIEEGVTWTSVSGTLNGNVTWGEDARISVTGHLQIPAGSSLTILEGAVVRLDPGVNIMSSDRIRIEGTKARPVVFTPVTRAQPWGGFFLTNTTSRLEATAAIFIGAGSRQTGFPGHRREQPLLFVDSIARVAMTNCAAIYLAGQFHHSFNHSAPYATVTMVDSLIQRCTTAGEFNGCSLTFIDSALIEIPYEDQFICADPDCDHDGFYLNAGDHYLEGSLLGWAKDDCIDAGSGGGPSSVTMTNCWVEGAYHEGCAWSGGGRTVSNLRMVNINNGQGIEAGWSSGSLDSPVVNVRDSLSLANAVGMRFGDNYDWDYWGFLDVKDSIILDNFRDVWGLNWDNWRYGINTRDGSFAMDIQNNFLTAPNTNHPNNAVWDPSADASRLESFMTIPPQAAVGVGFALWESQLPRAKFVQGVPVRLSHFSTNVVSVDVVVSSGGSTQTYPVVFQPGETVKRVSPSGDNDASFVLSLENPVRAEITGLDTVTVDGAAVAPTVSCLTSGTQIDLARLPEGIPVGLSVSSAEAAAVSYRLESADGVLASGVLEFAPGETLVFVSTAGLNPADHEFLRFSLADPSGATLGSPSSIYLIETATAPPQPNETLIARGATWSYRADASAAPTGWQNPGFDDAAWSDGPAQLGFGEGDEQTTIPDNNQITSYFRHAFNVADASGFDELRMWMLRDDGGVVYLNGAEVFRSPNVPPGPISYNTLTVSPNGENTIDTATFGAGQLVSGSNVLAVEMHQQSSTSSDVSFDFELVGVPTPLPAPPQTLHLGTFDGQLILAWGDPAFRLQTADAVEGPWSLSFVSSPFVLTVDPQVPQKFYRLIRLGF